MRKNKKLLLASVAAMGALALGVGATSTFAWYQVSQSGQLLNSTGDSSGIISAQSHIDVGTLDLPVSVSVTQSANNVDLMTYESSEFREYYYLEGDATNTAPTRYKTLTLSGANPHYILATVTITITSQDVTGVGTMSAAQIADLLAGSTYYVTVARKGSSKAVFYASAAATTAPSNGNSLTNGLVASNTFRTKTAQQEWGESDGQVSLIYSHTFGIWVDGADSTYNQHISGDCTVTVTKTNPNT